jgi:hypothetical protein
MLLRRFSHVTLRTLVEHLGVPRSIWGTAVVLPRLVDVQQLAAAAVGLQGGADQLTAVALAAIQARRQVRDPISSSGIIATEL